MNSTDGWPRNLARVSKPRPAASNVRPTRWRAWRLSTGSAVTRSPRVMPGSHAPRGVTTEHPVMSMGSALVAQSSFSRVIGNSVTLLPRALKTAFAMAAGTPTKTSPASPFTPSKWLAERRIEANQEFHSAALTLADTAREGFRERNRRKVLDSIPKAERRSP